MQLTRSVAWATGLLVLCTLGPAAAAEPEGYLDGVNNGVARGWALDRDAPTQSIMVHVYLDGPAGQGALLGGIRADQPRGDVNRALGVSGQHGYVFRLPARAASGRHQLYLYAVNVGSGSNRLLSGSPMTLGAGSAAPATAASRAAARPAPPPKKSFSSRISVWLRSVLRLFGFGGGSGSGSGSAGAPPMTPPPASPPSASGDPTPPTLPVGLRITHRGSDRIALDWQASRDPQSGVASYRIYRGGRRVGQSATTTFADTGLQSSQTYRYEVSAVNGAGGESVRSSGVAATTSPPSATPPASGLPIGPVTIRGNQFLMNGRPFVSKTDFLTPIAPGASVDTTHTYLSRSAGKQQQLRRALKGSGYNTIYIYTLNQNDYRGPSVTPYGNGGFNFDVNQLNSGRVAAWQGAVRQLAAEGLLPVIWLAADDSSGIARAPVASFRRYLDHMVAAFESLPVMWVLGLEVDEYWSPAQVAERRVYLQSKTAHPVGVHLTTSASSDLGSPYKNGFDFVLLQLGFGHSTSRYVSETRRLALNDRPTIAAEYNVSQTSRSRAIGRAILATGRVAGVGNGG